MKSIIIIVCVVLRSGANQVKYKTQSCGVDRSSTSLVYEGLASIQDYPWMGTLYYDLPKDIFTTAVILVTKQIAIASAHEVDKLPREEIRQRTRVVLGNDCKGPAIRIRDYSFHPEYRRSTFQALALIQLETDHLKQELIPICPAPTFLHNPTYFAVSPSSDCKKGRVQIRKIKFLEMSRCKRFYRRTGLDNDMFWPTDATCAHALRGGNCVWRSGTALVIKQHGRWHLLGFGMHGPGCQSPARFVDTAAQTGWLRRSVARTGSPSITRLADDHIVLRRPLSNVQRFGPCDPEETTHEIYMDRVIIKATQPEATTHYNLTLIHGVEYSCVVFRAMPDDSNEADDGEPPRLHLRRWCAGPPSPCYSYQFLEIEFFVEIEFSYDIAFEVRAYGKVAKYIEPEEAMVVANIKQKRPEILIQKKKANNMWFAKKDVAKISLIPQEDADWANRNKKG